MGKWVGRLVTVLLRWLGLDCFSSVFFFGKRRNEKKKPRPFFFLLGNAIVVIPPFWFLFGCFCFCFWGGFLGGWCGFLTSTFVAKQVVRVESSLVGSKRMEGDETR